MDQFWVLFWPTVAATLVGVIGGVPIALWLNRVGHEAVVKRERSESRSRLRNGIDALVEALIDNKKQLDLLTERFGHDRMPFDASLDAAAWAESREEIVPFLRRPDLQRRVARYFARLESVRRLHSLYVELALGVGVGTATAPTKTAGDELRAHLVHEAHDLATTSNSLLRELRQVRDALLPSND